MHLVHIDEESAATLISRATRHLPPGNTLGKIFAVGPAGVLVRDGAGPAVFGVDDNGTWRVVDLADDLHEVTRWFEGVEVVRGVTRVRI